ncbi:MAG: NAD(+)/NADH kinase [Armatimonadota bacterium]
MKTVSIILNDEKENAVRLASELVPWLREQDIIVLAEHSAAKAICIPEAARDDSDLVSADFALVLGGDGTLLRASRIMSPVGIPMLPIRFGKFGFLTDIEPCNAKQALISCLDGNYDIDERMMLRNHVYRDGRLISTSDALNDAVIAKGPLARMLRLRTLVSGKYISTYAADGLIAATPTGSTAYSLSAGGPLVAPDLHVIIVTPICPHTLNTRALVISQDKTLEVEVESGGEDDVMLTVDGQLGVPLEPGDTVCVEKSSYTARLISVSDITFYDKLQTRLRWGDRFDT